MSLAKIITQCWIFFLAAICLMVSDAFAQFKPDTYFPKLGNPVEIDSIYGWKNEQMLGRYIQNLGYSEVRGEHQVILGEGFIRNYRPDSNGHVSIYTYTDKFDLRKLKYQQDVSFLVGNNGFSGSVQVAHLRSGGIRDLVVQNTHSLGNAVRIYWSDGMDGYDSSRFSVLQLPWVGEEKERLYSAFNPIVGNFGGSTDEIIVAAELYYDDPARDSVYLLRFGGDVLATDQAKVIYPSEYVFWRRPDTNGARHRGSTLVGGFNGDGLNDVIYFPRYGDHALLYSGQPQFNLADFGLSFLKDTLLHGSVAGFTNFLTNRFSKAGFVFQKKGGQFQDLALGVSLDSEGKDRAVYVYRGSGDFGKSPLEEPDAKVLPPKDFDVEGFVWGLDFWNSGDMSGKGHDVLAVVGTHSQGLGTYFFYNLDESIDDSVDMSYTLNRAAIPLHDTLDANADGKTDVLIGLPDYHTYDDAIQGKTYVGTVHLLYGSSRILGNTSAVEISPEYSRTQISLWPLPASDFVNIDLNKEISGPGSIRIYNTLGQLVKAQQTEISNGQLTLSLNNLASGNYRIAITLSTSQNFSFSLLVTN